MTASPSLPSPSPAWESHSGFSKSAYTKLISRKFFSPAALPVVDSAHLSHPLPHSHSQNDHIIYRPNRVTLSVKRSTVNNYPRTTSVDWNCPGEAGHTATLFPPLCKDTEYWCGILYGPCRTAPLEWLGRPYSSLPYLGHWVLLTQCLSCHLPNKGLFYGQKHWGMKDEGGCKMTPQSRKLWRQEALEVKHFGSDRSEFKSHSVPYIQCSLEQILLWACIPSVNGDNSANSQSCSEE